MSEHRHSGRLLAIILVVVLTTSLGVSLAGTAGHAGTGVAPPSFGTAGGVRVPSAAGSEALHPAAPGVGATIPLVTQRAGSAPTYGSVAETLVFINNTLLAGNFTAVENGVEPTQVAVDEAHGLLFVADAGSSTVSIVNTTNGTVTGRIVLTEIPVALAVDLSLNELLVVTTPPAYLGEDIGSVLVLDASSNRVLANVSLSEVPDAAAFDSTTGNLYVPFEDEADVAVVNLTTNAVQTTVPLDSPGDAAAFDPANGEIYVANGGTSNLSVIQPANNTVETTVPVTADPDGIQPLAGTDFVYVADRGTDELTVLNGSDNLVVSSVPLSFGPVALAADSAVGLVFAVNSTANDVAAINYRTQSVITTTGVGTSPIGVAEDSANGDLYVADSASDNVTVLNAAARTTTGTIQLGLIPVASAYDRASNELGVVFSDENSLWIYNATTDARILSVAVGTDPVAVAYDQKNECFYVANAGSSSVTVFNGSTNARAATVPVASGPDALAYAAAYDYVFVADGNLPPASSAITEIDGANNQVVGTLPVGSDDPVSSLVFDSTNGNLYAGAAHSIVVVDPTSRAVVTSIHDDQLASTLAVDPNSGEVLAGSVRNLSGGFDHTLSIIDPATNQVVTNVTVANCTEGIDFDSQDGLAYVSSGCMDSVSVVNVSAGAEVGSLSVGVNPAGISDDGAGGQVFVTDTGSATLSIITLPGIGHYPIEFSEHGLPVSHSWTVTIGGHQVSSTTSSLVIVEADGTFAFNVTPVAGYAATPNASSVVVGDSFASVQIAFAPLPPTYAVLFQETGLPSGANWSVLWAGTDNVSSAGTSLTIQAGNGTFAWTVFTVAGYAATTPKSSTTVAGGPVTVNVTFQTTSSISGSTGPSGLAAFGAVAGYGLAGVAAIVGLLAGAVVGRGRAGGPPSGTPEPEPTAPAPEAPPTQLPPST
jgi:YVTN family beta-propeller protein